MRSRAHLISLATALSLAGCTCAASHTADAGHDAGADAGRDAGSRDAGPDTSDAGRDGGHVCPPNPMWWTEDGGFVSPWTGETVPYCEWDNHCFGVRSLPDHQLCSDGVCCNGTFNAETCTCSCGAEGECPPFYYCCPERRGEVPRCVYNAGDCYVGSGP